MLYKKSAALVLCLLFLSGLSGCENSIDPLDKETGLFSVYGTLDLRSNLNYIRVKDLNIPLQQDTTGAIEASVVFEDLDRGLIDTMQDSIVEFDGVKTHNFYTDMDILPDSRYRVTVENLEGSTVTAEAITPHIAETNVEPVSEPCLTQIRLTFDPLLDRNDIALIFGFRYENQLRWVVPRAGVLGEPGDFFDDETETEIFSFTPKAILDIYPTSEDDELWCHELDSDILYVRYTHYGPDFFNNSTSDSLNVPNSTGRLGALYRDTLSFQIDTSNVCKPFC